MLITKFIGAGLSGTAACTGGAGSTGLAAIGRAGHEISRDDPPTLR
jgi:hypothetical protein